MTYQLCVCHSIRSMFRVLGIHDFVSPLINNDIALNFIHTTVIFHISNQSTVQAFIKGLFVKSFANKETVFGTSFDFAK